MTATAPTTINLLEAVQRTGASTAFEKAVLYSQAATDAVVDTRTLNMVVYDRDSTLTPIFDVAGPDGKFSIAIADMAHRQLAEKLGIPFDYYNRMKAGQPDLLAQNVNTWLSREPSRHLLRLLRPVSDEDGRALNQVSARFRLRAVLSPKYRPLDNAALLNTVLPVAAEHGARVAEFHYGDDRFHLRLVGAERALEEIRREYAEAGHGNVHERQANGNWIADGEVVSFGLALRNSETGNGSLSVEPYAKIIRCLNGIIVSESFRAIHVGRSKEDGFIQEDTKRLEDAAVFLRVRDKAVELFGPESRFKVAHAIEAGVNNALDLPEDLPMFEFVGNVGQTFDLTEKEIEILKEEVAGDLAHGNYPRHLGAGPTTPLNQFAMSQGMTALARRVGAEDFDRRTDLEKMGWEILVSPVEKLLKAGKSATN